MHACIHACKMYVLRKACPVHIWYDEAMNEALIVKIIRYNMEYSRILRTTLRTRILIIKN